MNATVELGCRADVTNSGTVDFSSRPELKAYGLRTEPWLFVFDDSGRIATRIEGAFSVADLEAAVEKARPEP
ncbi:MAG: hypothetical protein GEU88_16460 [Solirubrobacterales bacterium]|nr:hypothetical protein [Solirubrobacterales bacterium]